MRRHARVIGKDPNVDELTVVGIGDMSGDVFGNGMLLSPTLRSSPRSTIATSSSTPIPTLRVARRTQRLFELPVELGDYDPALDLPEVGSVPGRSSRSRSATRCGPCSDSTTVRSCARMS